MKFQLSSLVSLLGVLLLLSCDKTVVNPSLEPVAPAAATPQAGTWKTYVLSSPNSITIPLPSLTNSESYKREVEQLKAATTTLTPAQREAIQYWGAGSVFRWNEIAREIAARYNNTPSPLPDGTYPLPDPANPLATPKFPIASPPFVARLLAYLGVAQYDALVSAWHYMYLYKRPAPYQLDKDIRPLLPLSTLPSYPSAEAVAAGASHAVLARMFPGELPLLDQKLQECLNARQWAGMNVESELLAGSRLGKAVADKVLEKAATDGMSGANNQSLLLTFTTQALKLGIKEPWVSQEIPVRPALLPNFGALRPWNLTREQLVAIRPPMPYVVGSPEWQKELDELRAVQRRQTREQARIANFWADGPGSYSPPGHWNRRATELTHQFRLNEVETARAMALVGTSLMDAAIACWEAKYHYMTPRPQQFGLKTSVGVPNFPAYTSGHSTFSGAAATVLALLFPTEATRLHDMAKEASESRIYGLIHFRIDCEEGIKHGNTLGSLAIERAKKEGILR